MFVRNYLKSIFAFLAIISLPDFVSAQNNVGMATGNYAGISSLWMNPANAVDSRYKFDINIIGLNSYYCNNYLLVKNTALVRRLFNKSPYNSSFDEVKKDLLQESIVNGKVYAHTVNNIQFPLSFMVTTGKKSAIALTMANRTINKLDSLNPETAKSFYDELRNPSLYNNAMNNDALRYNFLNWQEVGLTYGRIIIGKGNIFLKAAVTAKWLGAGAAGFIQADKLSVSFKDSNTVSLVSPLIRYGRTATADLGAFQRKNIFNNIEDQALGIDAGIVFEVRTRLNRYKYTDEDDNIELRRDKNKYLFRLGISVVDLGQFRLNRKPLTNNHSASILNWNFGNVKANNLSDFDTAYSRQVNYIAGTPSTFTYRLPAAIIVNFDLHLVSGFYVNVAAKQPLSGYGKKADTHIQSDRWVVVTPRFETKFFGIYVPVSRVNNRTNIGATVKFGPFYAGSNNLAEILSNKKTYEADFHVGVRLSILQGKPPKIFSKAKNMISQDDDVRERRTVDSKLDSLSRELELLKRKLPDTATRPVINVIIQNSDSEVKSEVLKSAKDDIVIMNKSKKSPVSSEPERKDTTSEFLLRQLATNQVEIKRLQEELKNQESRDIKKNESSKTRKNSQEKKSKSQKESKSDNEDIEKELSNLRKQMAIQNAAQVAATVASGAVVANAIRKDTVFILKTDSLNQKGNPSANTDINLNSEGLTKVEGIVKQETVIVRDTVLINTDRLVKGISHYQSVYFETGKSNLSGEAKIILNQVVADLKDHPDWNIELSGRTDASGSLAANQKVAKARIDVVKNFLLQEGIPLGRILTAVAHGYSKEKNVTSQRRVDLVILEK